MPNYDIENGELDLLDIITIISLFIGIENLSLNTKQVENLDEHLKQQDDILLRQQNKMLKTIIKQNEEIIKLLKGE